RSPTSALRVQRSLRYAAPPRSHAARRTAPGAGRATPPSRLPAALRVAGERWEAPGAWPSKTDGSEIAAEEHSRDRIVEEVEAAAHPVGVEAERPAPTKIDEEDDQGAQRIEMVPGVKGKPAVEPGRLVAPRNGQRGMRHLVRDQADYQRRHEVERVDDEPAR